MLDRIIFGDNQFFGINHMSEEKAQNLSERFNDLNHIMDVLDNAYECGIRAFMFNTHDRVKDICDVFRRDPQKYQGLKFYPSMPYAHKYANLVAEKGIFGALKHTILDHPSAAHLGGLLSKGTQMLFAKDMFKVMQILIDMEMRIFDGLEVKVIFLQNIVTDLLLGFGIKEVFVEFDSYIQAKYGAEAGYITLNMPKLVEFLQECGIENPIICSAINKAGYFMNPDKAAYEQCLQRNRFRAMAMSILASGAIKPKEAVRYVCQHPSIQAIVYGASKKDHIMETKKLIESFSKC